MKQNQYNHNFWLLAIISSYLIASVNCQDFQSPCSATQPCSAEKYLTCLDNYCECEDPENQIYDPIEGECVIVAGKPCPRSRKGTAQCVQGADCDPATNTCQCLKGFYETELNICSYTIGKLCSTNNDCETYSGLICQDNVCKCQNSSYIWQLDLGCVTANDVLSIGAGIGNSEIIKNVTSASSNNNEMSSVEVIDVSSSSSEVKPVTSNSSLDSAAMPITSNVIDGGNNSLISEESVSDIGDRLEMGMGQNQNQNEIIDRGVLQNIIQNSPILSLLNPNRRPQNTFNPQPSFIPNDQNFAPSQQQQAQNNQNPQQPQNSNQNPQQPQNSNQNPQQPQNLNQNPQQPQNLNQNPQQLQNFNQNYQQNTNNFQRPSNAVPNIFTPPDLPGQTANRRPFQFPILRNILAPWKRFLFPRLAEQDVRLPSPIWLLVSSINQLLPVLRAIDHQVSPWLQTVAEITRPAYIPSTRDQNNGQYQYQQNNNNWNQQQPFQQNFNNGRN